MALAAPAVHAQAPPASTPQTQTGTPPTPGTQTTPERIVTATPPGTVSNSPWSVTFQLFEGLDGDNTGKVQNATGTSVLAGPSTGATAHLRYKVPAGRKNGITLDAGNTVTYYSRDSNWISETDLESTQWHQFGRNTTVSAAETYYRTPYYSIGAFPGLGNFTGTDLSRPFLPTTTSGLETTGAYRFGVDAKVNHIVNLRNSYSAFYRGQGMGIAGVDSLGMMNEVGGRYTHVINRALGYHLGYSYGNTRFGGYSPTNAHNIDVGLDLQKTLSVTRRTTLSFTTGTTFVKARSVDASATDEPTTDFHLLGHVDLTHYIGQTWAAIATYDRGLQMLDAVLIPYYSDGVTVGLAGLLGQHTSVGLSSAYIAGVPLGITSVSRDKAFIESAWIQHELGRKWAAYAQYSFYAQRFTLPDSVTAIDLPQRLNRNSARFGVTLVLPSNRQTRLAPQQPGRPVR